MFLVSEKLRDQKYKYMASNVINEIVKKILTRLPSRVSTPIDVSSLKILDSGVEPFKGKGLS